MSILFKSFIWDFTGKASNQLISFITGLILARILSPEDYGIVGIALVFIVFSGIISNIGLGKSLIQKDKVYDIHFSTVFFVNIVISSFVSLLLFLLSDNIASFFEEPKLSSVIKVLSISPIATSLFLVQEAILVRNLKFKIIAKVRVYSIIFGGCLGITLALNNCGVWSLVFQYIAIVFSKIIFFWVFASWRPQLIFSFKELKTLWNYGFSIFLSGFLYYGFNQISSIVIAKMFTSYDLGLFSRAKTLNQFAYKYSFESIGNVVFPIMAKMQNNISELVKFGIKIESIIAFLSFGLFGLLYIISEPLILFLLGNKWLGSVEIFKLLCLSSFVYPLSVSSLNMLKSAGYSKTNLKLEIIKVTIGVTGLIIGFQYGIKGYLISLIFTGLIEVLVNIYFTSKTLKYDIKRHFKPNLIQLFLAILTTYLVTLIEINFESYILNIGILSVTFLSIYLFVNFVFKANGFTELKFEIVKLIKRNSNDS